MMKRFAGAITDTEEIKIEWLTLDTNPEYAAWRRYRQGNKGPFHLTRMVRSSEGAEKAIFLLRMALNYYAADYAFVYQTTWPVVWGREFQVLKRQGLEVAVVEEKGWLVATTLVFPGFKRDLELWAATAGERIQ